MGTIGEPSLLSIINGRRIVAGTKLLFQLHPPGRNLPILPDDTFLVSYGKSGTTWTSFLIANLVHPGIAVTFGNINDLILDPDALAKRRLVRIPGPRILKSHYCFEPRYPRIIYVVRDPRDVVVSQFHMHRKRNVFADDYPMEKFATRFVAGQTSVYPGSWGEHVGGWLGARNGRLNFLLVRYEDMLSDAGRELARIATFLEIDPKPEQIARAVALSCADQMRQLEKTSAHLWTTTKGTRKDVPFVRSATSGGWRSSLPNSSVAEIELAWGSLMRWLGYELSSGVAPNESSYRFHELVLSTPPGYIPAS